MRVAVVGASGAVGRKILELIEERGSLPLESPPALFASEASAGRETPWGRLRSLESELAEERLGYDLVLMSAGAGVSREWAPRFAEAGAVVIDNSSAWRARPDVPLVVCEVNPERVSDRPLGIIANPNCVAMGALIALSPLHQLWGLESLVATSFQAAGGAGGAGITELLDQIPAALRSVGELTHGGDLTELREAAAPVHGRALAMNVIPLLGELSESGGSGLTDEEEKMISEPRKILELPELKVSPTCVRVPTLVGHGSQLRASFREPVELSEALGALERAESVSLAEAPTPHDAVGAPGVLVGRLRADPDPRSLNVWVVSDNLRTGAATNAVKLAELVASEGAG